MNIIEELKKKLQCPKCSCSYSKETKSALYNKCKHHTCFACLQFNFGSARPSENYPPDPLYHYQCPVCACSTSVAEFPLFAYVSTALNEYTSLSAKANEDEKALRRENAILQQERYLWNVSREDHHKCVECETTDSEQNLHLCETCHKLKFRDFEDVKKHALCSTCAIKKHMRQGHQTVDFFPYLRAYNFSSQSPTIKSKSEDLVTARDLLKFTVSDFNALSINVSENYNLLTDMAQRSKCTKVQVEFFEKMEKFINESKSIHVEADSDIKKHSIKLKDNLVKLREWYESRMKNCVDESEIIKLEKSEDSDENDTEVDA